MAPSGSGISACASLLDRLDRVAPCVPAPRRRPFLTGARGNADSPGRPHDCRTW